MIRYFKKKDKQASFFYIMIEDQDYNLKIGIDIVYKTSSKQIRSLNLRNSKGYDNFFKEYEEWPFIKEIDEFEVMFNELYLEIFKKAIGFHKKKYKQETVLDKIIQKYNILNINNV